MSNYVFNGNDMLSDDGNDSPFKGITGTLVGKFAMTQAGYNGLIAMNTTFKDLANHMTEQSQHTFSEQEVEGLYSPDNFDFDKTELAIVAGRPVTEVNIQHELFPL